MTLFAGLQTDKCKIYTHIPQAGLVLTIKFKKYDLCLELLIKISDI